MVYESSLDAVKQLILVGENSAYVSWISGEDSTLMNGINYCLVEITCSSGTKFTIIAYGDEALSLHCEVRKLMRTNH
ncbi:MAG TPA: hypothetical protein VH415_10285 [Nitrososphaeraceae archaeon]|jgi:hypothetical protein